jgi:catechol 2,3-dioxygenase-like lactoylglutathione lyase family enzyme
MIDAGGLGLEGWLSLREGMMTGKVAIGLVVVLAGLLGVGPAGSQTATARLTTVAFRVHHKEAMVRFYTEAFGARFRAVETNGIRSEFGELPDLTLKFVPIREAAEFDSFPVHQPGFDVPDVARVIEIALHHGGRVQDAPARDGGRVHAAVRDPDGNTIELYGPR